MHIQTKPDFGDIDVLYLLDESKISYDDFYKYVENRFNSEEVRHVGPCKCYHFNVPGYPGFQVDLMNATNENNLKFQHFYLSHSDFGSIVGQLCSQLGYTFSDTNLKIKVFYNNNPAQNLGTIELTNDINEVCEFLGYDYKRLQKPFNTDEEFFRFMASGKHFKPEFFHLGKSFNHTHRKRAAKRPVYMKFMEYIEKNFDTENNKSVIDKGANKAYAAEKFGVLDQYQKYLDDFTQHLKYKQKFNADIVKKLLPVFEEQIEINKKNGVVLGKFMNMLKSDLSELEVLEMSDVEIECWVLMKYSEFDADFL